MGDNNIKVKIPWGGEYDIWFHSDFGMLSDYVKELGFSGKRICIISDDNVYPLYGDAVTKELSKITEDVTSIIFKAGEENKNLDTVKEIYKGLIGYKLDRKDLVVALGGGVVGDMAGFAAATYLRGIDFIQIPTTLLSCTDSSIGGKTGVDLDEFKNMVGAFHMPRMVYMNVSTLKSLSEAEFASGMGEVLKHGLIKDAGYYEWLINNFSEINDRDPDILSDMIRTSCMIKAGVVERDPKEMGERALLNFGHTIGHAIEKYMDFGLRHGECVALGTIAASYISYRRQYLTTEEYYEIRDMFVPFGLPITLPDDADRNRILEYTKSDKKMQGGKIRFILLKGIGQAYIETDVTDEEILDGIGELIINDEGD